jgi:hypothetical protein
MTQTSSFLRLIALFIAMLLGAVSSASAQTAGEMRSGVVKITSIADGVRRTGTGFIVQASNEEIYVATASHVVEGDKAPKVAFLPDPNAEFASQVLKIEGGDPKGLALLVVRGNVKRLLRDLRVLPFSASNDLAAGDAVTAIGFPQGGGGWAVVPATVASREGRELVLSGSIAEGNSGGPILKDGAVVGLVTGTQGQYARATPAVIVRFTMEGWGVKPVAAGTPPAAAPPVPLKQQASPPVPAPTPPPATNTSPQVAGYYTGQLQGRTVQQQTYTCGFAATFIQAGQEVSGQYSNTCGDQGAFGGQVMSNALIGQTLSQVNGGYCGLAIEIVGNGASLKGEYECANGETGSFTMVRN